MADKLRQAAQQALYAMAMLIDPEKLEPWQIELYDKTTNALRAALAEQPAEQESMAVVPPIDYDALIAAAYATNKKWAQGTNGCIAFKHGAEWFRNTLTAPEAPQPAKRESLTDFDIADRFYAIGGAGANSLRYFAAGVRYAEATHGIGGGK